MSGTIPEASSSRDRPAPTANRPACATAVPASSSPLPFRTRPATGTSSSPDKTSHAWSNTPANTAERSRSSRPIPGYWLP